MPTEITQSFLPLLARGNHILGLVAIPTTTFDGTEETWMFNGKATPLKRVSYGSNINPERVVFPGSSRPANVPRLLEYTALEIDEREARLYRDAGRMTNSIGFTFEWFSGPGIQYHRKLFGMLGQFLWGSRTLADPSTITVTTPTEEDPVILNAVWTVDEVPFTTDATCQFFDVDLAVLIERDYPDLSPANITIGAPTDDPATGAYLKAMLVSSNVNSLTGHATNTTVRVIRLGTTKVEGTYTWPIEIETVEGQSFTISLTMEVA